MPKAFIIAALVQCGSATRQDQSIFQENGVLVMRRVSPIIVELVCTYQHLEAWSGEIRAVKGKKEYYVKQMKFCAMGPGIQIIQVMHNFMCSIWNGYINMKHRSNSNVVIEILIYTPVMTVFRLFIMSEWQLAKTS